MPRASAEDRLTRLLAIIPWVVERGGATVEEIASRFGLPVDDVVADLSLAQCCEIPPYGPDNTLGITVVDGEVLVEPSPMITGPLQLSPREGFGLLAAGRAALAVPGADADGALASAIAKLERVIGDRGALVVDLDRPELLPALREAVDARSQLEIEYYAAYSDEVSTRVVDPLALVNRDGNWYLRAWCHRAGDERTFRVDRIEAATATGDVHDRGDPRGELGYVPGEDAQEVVVAIPASERWVVEAYPTESVDESGDELLVTMVVTGEVFLERLLLRLGVRARVVSPPELTDVGRDAAARLLSAYR